jgi:hypothetical protein
MNDTTTLLSFTDSIGYVRISVPVIAPNSINSVVVIDVSGVPVASTQYVKVTGITVKSQSGLKIIYNNGDTLQMSTTLLPTNASDKTVTWTVRDTTLATISATGLLTAKRNGKDTVLATANDGSDIQGKLVITISGQTGIDDHHGQSLPLTMVLEQNYPNPFNSTTIISFTLPSTSFVSLKIFDALGREVSTLLSEELSAGIYSQQWNASDFPSGIYFYRLQAGSFAETKKLILLK